MKVPGLQHNLMPFLDDAAPALLDKYYRSPSFTGARFESLGGGGDRLEAKDAFVADDIVAVGLLSVSIPPEASLRLLEDDAAALSELLVKIPVGVSLTEPGARQLIDSGSPADVLWHRLIKIDGIAWVTAHKLLARKRPHLLPVYDRVVKVALQPTQSTFWLPLWETLQDDAVRRRLEDLRHGLGLDISLLRVLDVAVWMRSWGAANEEPSAP